MTSSGDPEQLVELGGFSWWLSNEGLPPEWRLAQLEVLSGYPAALQPGLSAYQFLAEVAARWPLRVVRVLRTLIDERVGTWPGLVGRDHIREALSSACEATMPRRECRQTSSCSCSEPGVTGIFATSPDLVRQTKKLARGTSGILCLCLFLGRRAMARDSSGATFRRGGSGSNHNRARAVRNHSARVCSCLLSSCSTAPSCCPIRDGETRENAQ